MQIRPNVMYNYQMSSGLVLDGIDISSCLVECRAAGELLETWITSKFQSQFSNLTKNRSGGKADLLLDGKIPVQQKSFKTIPKNNDLPGIYIGLSADWDKTEAVVPREQRLTNLWGYLDLFEYFFLVDKRFLGEGRLSFVLTPTQFVRDRVSANETGPKSHVSKISYNHFLEAGFEEVCLNER